MGAMGLAAWDVYVPRFLGTVLFDLHPQSDINNVSLLTTLLSGHCYPILLDERIQLGDE